MLYLTDGHESPCGLFVFVSNPCPTQPADLRLLKLASCPEGTEATTLDIAKAYRNSPIAPAHKPYLPIMWDTKIYVQHVAIEGLATAGGIQRSVADACIELLKHEGIHPVMKWVDNFVFFRSPTIPTSDPPTFAYDLHSIQSFTSPLGIPWHPI